MFSQLVLFGFSLQTLVQFIRKADLLNLTGADDTSAWSQYITVINSLQSIEKPPAEVEQTIAGLNGRGGNRYVAMMFSPEFGGLFGYSFAKLDPQKPLAMELVRDLYSPIIGRKNESTPIALRVMFGPEMIRRFVSWTEAAEQLKSSGIEIPADEEWFQNLELTPAPIPSDLPNGEPLYHVFWGQEDGRFFLLFGKMRLLN